MDFVLVLPELINHVLQIELGDLVSLLEPITGLNDNLLLASEYFDPLHDAQSLFLTPSQFFL